MFNTSVFIQKCCHTQQINSFGHKRAADIQLWLAVEKNAHAYLSSIRLLCAKILSFNRSFECSTFQQSGADSALFMKWDSKGGGSDSKEKELMAEVEMQRKVEWLLVNLNGWEDRKEKNKSARQRERSSEHEIRSLLHNDGLQAFPGCTGLCGLFPVQYHMTIWRGCSIKLVIPVHHWPRGIHRDQ